LKEIAILVILLVQILLPSISSSELSLIGMGGQDAVTRLSGNSLNQSSDGKVLKTPLSGTYIQNASSEYDRNSEKFLCSIISDYSIDIPPNNDPTDIYYPDCINWKNQKLPFVLVLQGANVDKSFYRGFARAVASYGFVVVVPNHESIVIVDKGLYAEEKELNDILAFMIKENANSSSPLSGRIDTNTMLLLGHSYGGAASLYAIQDKCQFPFCIGLKFHRPVQLKGGAFYGTNLKGPIGSVPELDNDGIPIALIQGSMDGLAAPAEGLETFYKIKYPPKAFITIMGANHYGITDIDIQPVARPDANAPQIPQKDAVETIARWSALFLRAYILSDEDARIYIELNAG
jgi:hypothetical protein